MPFIIFPQNDDENPTVMLKDSIDLKDLMPPTTTETKNTGGICFEVKEEDDLYSSMFNVVIITKSYSTFVYCFAPVTCVLWL